MPRINKLSEQVINQIAAGEVVDRPASVIKELVENSIDAESTRVEISIERGGKKLIRIVDNGIGMDKEDLDAAVKRHWTSKISEADDLQKIQTFGFRGEALASISSVSRFEIRSRQHGVDEGWSLSVDENGESLIRPIGMPSGTEIVVNDLFYNVPARQQFLKQDSTEASHIQELVYQLALINPSIMFVLFKDGRKIFQSPGGHEIRPLLNAVLGETLAQQMLPIKAEHPQMEVSGWVGKPGTGSASKPRQYAFVNGRIVDNRLLWSAVQEGYGSVIGRHEKAQFILRIDIAPHLVDVNVHPQKKEIKFSNPQLVFQLIRQGVANVLSDLRASLPTPEVLPMSSYPMPENSSTHYPKPTQPRLSYPTASSSRTVGESYELPPKPASFELPTSTPEPVHFTPERSVKAFQMLDLFIFEEGGDGIIVYDQHAVHERVLYEKFSQQYLSEKSKRLIQPLLVPSLIEVSPSEFNQWEMNQELLMNLGFDIEPMGQGTLRVNAIPAVLSGNLIATIIKEFLQDLEHSDEFGESTVQGIDQQTHRRLAYLSCRSAIKAGDPLKPEEIRRLIQDFHATTVNFTCPHGRPVRVEFSRREMEKWFKR